MRAMSIGKLIIKAAWRTSRIDSCGVSVYCNDPVPSVVERDTCVVCMYNFAGGVNFCWIFFFCGNFSRFVEEKTEKIAQLDPQKI